MVPVLQLWTNPHGTSDLEDDILGEDSACRTSASGALRDEAGDTGRRALDCCGIEVAQGSASALGAG